MLPIPHSPLTANPTVHEQSRHLTADSVEEGPLPPPMLATFLEQASQRRFRVPDLSGQIEGHRLGKRFPQAGEGLLIITAPFG